ncbi:MAG: hypothetical protein P4L51_29750 [Puia sp.]|nr:hypothetical protein [Puia sp.]
MSQQETVATLKKKEVRKQIFEKLTGALSDYKEELGEKKLATHVKKASKLISRDLVKISKKNHHRSKPKKAAPKKNAKTRVKIKSVDARTTEAKTSESKD